MSTITITNCFGETEFEGQAREENYDFGPEDDLPPTVIAVTRQLKVKNATLNNFVHCTIVH